MLGSPTPFAAAKAKSSFFLPWGFDSDVDDIWHKIDIRMTIQLYRGYIMLYHNWWRAYHHHVISICNLNRQEAVPPCRPFIAPWQQRCAAKLHWASRTGRSISWLAKEHTPAKEVSLKSTTKPGIWSCSGQLGNWWKHHFSWINTRNRSRSHEFWADRRWSALIGHAFKQDL